MTAKGVKALDRSESALASPVSATPPAKPRPLPGIRYLS